MKVDYNIIDSHIIQRHANVLIDRAGDINLRFEENVKFWYAYMETTNTSSNSWAYIDCDAFLELVEMGTSIIPNVMNKFAEEKVGWWYMLLNTITGRQGTQVTFKQFECPKWSKWYVEEANLKALPGPGDWRTGNKPPYSK